MPQSMAGIATSIENAHLEPDDDEYPTITATTPMSQSSVTAIHRRTPSADDPQTELISTLRGQIQDLFTQVTQLNSKLVQSYDRVSDLEDDLHVTQSSLRQSTLKISQLELERTQHLSALNTGLLVERSNVVEELTRLMERATQEAAQRSSAESAKRNIETELEELSKDLFEGANGMVAEARYERFLSEKRAEESERRVRETEEKLVSIQQEMRKLDKGKWVPRTGDLVKERKLMSSHVPYQEFLGFVGHLRGLYGQHGQAAPAMSILLGLPFLTRIATEDSDPTLRLDLAPSLNWLSRRSVLAAIHNGCLAVESMSSAEFLHQLAQRQQRQGSTGFNLNNLSITVGSGGSGNTGTNHNTVSCALCGTNIFPGLDPASTSSQSQPVNHPTGPWPTSMSLFRKSSTASLNASQTSQGITPPPSPPLPSKAKAILGVNSSAEITQEQMMPEQVYIFRIMSTTTSSASTTVTSTNTTSSINSTAAPASYAPLPPPAHPPVSQSVPTRRGRSGTVSQSPFGSPTKVSKPSSSFQPSFSPFSSQSSSVQSTTINTTGTSSNGNTGPVNSTGTSPNTGTIYPLCTSTWCLTRLRATCEIWAFVRSGVVEKVWEEEVPVSNTMPGITLPLSSISYSNAEPSSNMPDPPPTHPSQHPHTQTFAPGPVPPIPPRKRGLWGTLESLSERAASWGSGSQSGSRPGTPSTPSAEEKEKKLPVLPPAPPPVHPSGTSDHQNPTSEIGTGTSLATVGASIIATSAPPPLPKRSEGRSRPLSTSTALKSVAETTTRSETEPTAHISDVNAILPEEDKENHTHTEVVFSTSPHDSPIHSPTPTAAQEPVKIPLPESRPSTPVISGLNTNSRPETPSNKPPSRSSTPSNASGLINSRPGTPSNKTVGVPPPLPRRAATRGPRPMSTKVPSESPGPSVGSVARTDEIIKEKGEENDVDEKIEKNEEGVTEGTDVLAESEKNEMIVGEKLSPRAGLEEKRENQEENMKLEEETGNTSTSTTKPDVESVEDERAETTRDKIESVNAFTEVTKPNAPSSLEFEKRVVLPYTNVGDSTWEEHAWREIVRLKEVMFWARIGGVESSQVKSG